MPDDQAYYQALTDVMPPVAKLVHQLVHGIIKESQRHTGMVGQITLASLTFARDIIQKHLDLNIDSTEEREAYDHLAAHFLSMVEARTSSVLTQEGQIVPMASPPKGESS